MSALSGICNHGLDTTVYQLLGKEPRNRGNFSTKTRRLHGGLRDLPCHLQTPQTETSKSLKKVSREEFGTNRPRTFAKFPKKFETSTNIVDFQTFLDFRTFLGTFWGSGVGGSQTLPSKRLFEICRGFSRFWAL